MEGDKPRVEKLRDADNWQQWQFVVSTLLDSEDALGVCDGTFVKPESTDQNYDQQLRKWIKADRLARKTIVTTVEAKPLQLLMNCENAREMWVKLHSVYDLKSDESLGLVQKQFFELKWDSSLNIVGHISKLEQMASKMKKLNSPIPDSMLMARILSILPVKFNHFHSAWESMDLSKRNIETLTTRLMTEELRLQKSEPDVDELKTALVTKAKFHHKKVFKISKECFTCGKTGHFRKDCPGCAKCGSKRHLQKDCPKSASAQMQIDDFGEKQAFVGVENVQKDPDIWLIDSGATNHITNRRDWFDTFKDFSEPLMIRVGNGESIAAYGSGQINVETYANGKWLSGTLYDVLYVPKIVRNLFSVKVAAKKGVDFVVNNNGKNCVFLRNEKIVAVGEEVENLYCIVLRVIAPLDKTAEVCVSVKTDSSCDRMNLWHERLGHQNKKHVQVFMKRFGYELNNDNEICDGCAYGKNHRQTFRDRKEERATEVREVIHSDVCGPMDTESLGGSRYYVLFKDDYSKYRVIYFIKNKSEVYEKMEQFLNEVKTQFTDQVKGIQNDGGKEYVNRNVQCLLKKRGIKQIVTVPYTPEQNGFVERENRTIVECARSMLYSKSYLPKSLWAEAMNTAVYILNRTGPTRIPGKTPIEIWSCKQPKVSHLRVFGTECFVHIPKEKRYKLDKKSYKGYLVGYTENVKGYRVWIPERNDVIVSRDVIFKNELLQPKEVSVDSEVDNKFEEVEETAQEGKSGEDIPEEDLPVHRNLRDRLKLKQPDFYGVPVVFLADDPMSFNEAVSREQCENWKNAMDEEMASLIENETWVLVEKPTNKKIFENRWVFRTKFKENGIIDRYKARLVIKGCSQQRGLDYNEIFSPVARSETIRVILSVAASRNLHLKQFDIKTAFLYGKVTEEIFMKQPEGYEDGTLRVCKLVKSLYGLKQAPRCWNDKFTSFLEECGFRESLADPCLYINSEKTILLLLYVDDGLIASSSIEELEVLLRKIGTTFKAKVTSNVKNYIGIEIEKQNDGSIFIHQKSYIRKILEKYGMEDAKVVATPIDPGWQSDTSFQGNEAFPYREIVGSLMFLQVNTRPDIGYALNVASRALEKPTEAHCKLVKRIIRYIKGTADFGLFYHTNEQLEVFCDADFAGDVESRKSTTGVICKLGGAAVSWQSRKQQCVALSTTEAEYMSATNAAKDLVWLVRILKEIGVNAMKYSNVPLCIDNQSAIRLIKNTEGHKRTKHIDIRFHFIRDLYKNGEFDIVYVPSENQIADIMTKPLAKPTFELLRNKVGLVSLC